MHLVRRPLTSASEIECLLVPLRLASTPPRGTWSQTAGAARWRRNPESALALITGRSRPNDHLGGLLSTTLRHFGVLAGQGQRASWSRRLTLSAPESIESGYIVRLHHNVV